MKNILLKSLPLRRKVAEPARPDEGRGIVVARLRGASADMPLSLIHISAQEVDFAQWYTDICTKAELVEYSSVKGFVVLRPYGLSLIHI